MDANHILLTQSVVEYLSAFDEEVLEAPALDSAGVVPIPVEVEEAVVGDVGESSTIVAGVPEVREMGVAEAACEKSKTAFSSGGTSSSPFYYFYQGWSTMVTVFGEACFPQIWHYTNKANFDLGEPIA